MNVPDLNKSVPLLADLKKNHHEWFLSGSDWFISNLFSENN